MLEIYEDAFKVNTPRLLTVVQKARFVQDGHGVAHKKASFEQGPDGEGHILLECTAATTTTTTTTGVVDFGPGRSPNEWLRPRSD